MSPTDVDVNTDGLSVSEIEAKVEIFFSDVFLRRCGNEMGRFLGMFQTQMFQGWKWHFVQTVWRLLAVR